jgi:hypothetical protein
MDVLVDDEIDLPEKIPSLIREECVRKPRVRSR